MAKSSVIDRMKRKLVAKALHKTRGKVSDACKLLEISRDQMYRIIDRDPELQELLKDIRDERRGIRRIDRDDNEIDLENDDIDEPDDHDEDDEEYVQDDDGEID